MLSENPGRTIWESCRHVIFCMASGKTGTMSSRSEGGNWADN